MPRTNDARFDALADVYARTSDNVADLVAEMLVTTSAAKRMRLHTEFLRRLRELDSQTQAWVAAFVAKMLEEEQDRLGLLVLLEVSPSTQNDLLAAATAAASSSILIRLGAAIAGVRALGSAAASGATPTAFQQQVLAARQSSANAIALRSALRNKLVSVLATTGAMIRYEPSYYAALTSFMEVGLAAQELVKQTMQSANRDLVRISPNLSTIGDFCDMYRGKVFSISGTHPVVPPLSSVPSGNVPMHPWCHHRLMPYDETGKTAEQLRQASRLPREFLDATASGVSTNALEKLWRSQTWKI